MQEYCGDILDFKTYSKSYKNKKGLENDRANWVVFQDVHKPILERAVFEQVQQKRGKIRKRRTHEGERKRREYQHLRNKNNSDRIIIELFHMEVPA